MGVPPSHQDEPPLGIRHPQKRAAGSAIQLTARGRLSENVTRGPQCAMAMRDDGMVPVLGDEDLAGLPSSGGPWQDLPLACFPMGTEKQLALTAKRLVARRSAPAAPRRRC